MNWSFEWKSPLSRDFMFDNWKYFFTGLTVKQWGFGFIWRIKSEKENIDAYPDCYPLDDED